MNAQLTENTLRRIILQDLEDIKSCCSDLQIDLSPDSVLGWDLHDLRLFHALAQNIKSQSDNLHRQVKELRRNG